MNYACRTTTEIVPSVCACRCHCSYNCPCSKRGTNYRLGQYANARERSLRSIGTIAAFLPNSAVLSAVMAVELCTAFEATSQRTRSFFSAACFLVVTSDQSSYLNLNLLALFWFCSNEVHCTDQPKSLVLHRIVGISHLMYDIDIMITPRVVKLLWWLQRERRWTDGPTSIVSSKQVLIRIIGRKHANCR